LVVDHASKLWSNGWFDQTAFWNVGYTWPFVHCTGYHNLYTYQFIFFCHTLNIFETSVYIAVTL